MKKILCCLVLGSMLFSCSKDEESVPDMPEDVKVNLHYGNNELSKDHEILIYDVKQDNKYLGSFSKATLSLKSGQYNLIAVGGENLNLANTENYKTVKLLQNANGRSKSFASVKIIHIPDIETISFEMEQVNGGVQIVSTDETNVGLDSVKVVVESMYDSYQLHNSVLRGSNPITIENTFIANGGVGFDETIYVLPGEVDLSLKYYVDGEIVNIKELGKVNVEAGKNVVKEVLFADDIVASVTIPNANFLTALEEVLPSEAFSAGKLIPDHESVKNLKELIIPKLQIGDLSGIEYFTGLEILDCHSNKIANLDFSALANLKELNCEFCNAKTIDVSGCVLLETFNCSANKITSIDLSKNVKLKYLNCSLNFGFEAGTSLEELDLSANSELVTLKADACRLESLDLSGKSFLEEVSCKGNFAITSLDLTGCASLERLYCDDNKIASLDLSDSPLLEVLYCRSNHMTSLSLSESTANLTEVRAQGANQAYTDITGLSAENQPLLKKLLIPESALCGENVKEFFTNGNWSSMKWGRGYEDHLTDYTLESCQ